ncbi:LemA family protein [Streptococcus thoraltensis]|uniref:LemA family protein n=1 Tax=Streptococcus thoraltensis TaxID=55085 RepID=UPI001F58304C|nr:LemA family protein [Streptococcus thoraltensis]
MNKPWFAVAKGILMILVLTMFWLIIFAALDTSGSELNYEPFNGASIVLGILSYVVILFIIQYNKVIKLKEEIASSFYAIGIKEGHVTKLIGQLDEVANRLLDHELKMSIKNTYSELVENEKTTDNITSDNSNAYHDQEKRRFENHSGSKNLHENYSQMSDKVSKLVERIERDTNGTANQDLRDLASEIKEAEVLVTNQRLHHNDTVSSYNKAIYELPFAFLRKTLGHVEQPYI